MSKYILEIKPEYEANGIMILGARDSHLYVTTIEVKDLEELNSDYINEHYGSLQDDAYQRGFEDGKAINGKVCEGCKYAGKVVTGPPCISCRNSYKNQWTAKDDKIEVGDVVERYLNDKLDSTGIYLGEDGDYWNCFFWTGAVFGTFAYPKNQFKKTGRHVDIDKILEDMRND